MRSERRLLITVFLTLMALIFLPLLVHHIRQSRRPVPVEARIVTATGSDPQHRTGRRTVAAGDSVDVALAVRIAQIGRQDRWLAPVEELVIDGHGVSCETSETWVEDELGLRVFWFTVESANLGGRLTGDTAAERLRYRTFLAPEMGRGLRAERLPEPHNDDHLGTGAPAVVEGIGTIRLYARVELVESPSTVRPQYTLSTLGLDSLRSPSFPALHLAGDFADGIQPVVGELFRLPGFEPDGDTSEGRNRVTVAELGATFNSLVDQRLVTSSWTTAAVAAAGRPGLDRAQLEVVSQIRADDLQPVDGGAALEWNVDLRAGDLIRSGQRWLVLVSDDGNGILDAADAVIHCWGRPPTMTTIFTALDGSQPIAELMRHER